VGQTPAGLAMERCDALATCSEDAGRLTRPFATPAMRRAQEMVRAWMVEAGMQVRLDNVGNLRGRYDALRPGSPTLILGSHLDSVRDAGRYDGPLGVVVAIAAVQELHKSGRRLPFGIEVIGFADEEGLRFGSTYLGSRAVAGGFDATELGRTDAAGTTMAEAIRGFGGDPSRIPDDRWAEGALLGYCEVHMEQGPVLEALNLPVGIVSAIAGQSRYSVTFHGEAGHAGTVPMDRRRDALAAAAEFVLAVEAEGRGGQGLMATVGRLDVQPGAANVIPREAVLSLDLRHAEDATRRHAAGRLMGRAEEIAGRRRVTVETRQVSDNPAVPCEPALVATLSRAVEDLGQTAVELASGAGHDGVPLSSLTGICMLFVRCKGGVSHSPDESVETADVGVAIDVLGRFLSRLGEGR